MTTDTILYSGDPAPEPVDRYDGGHLRKDRGDQERVDETGNLMYLNVLIHTPYIHIYIPVYSYLFLFTPT